MEGPVPGGATGGGPQLQVVLEAECLPERVQARVGRAAIATSEMAPATVTLIIQLRPSPFAEIPKIARVNESQYGIRDCMTVDYTRSTMGSL
jgi:hypothetical protein